MWLRRSLLAALIVFVGLSSGALGQDKKTDKKADEKKVDDKKTDDKKADDKKADDKKGDATKTKALLAWKLEKDKTFYQKMTTKTDQTMKVMNQEVKQNQTQTFVFSFTPTK